MVYMGTAVTDVCVCGAELGGKNVVVAVGARTAATSHIETRLPGSCTHSLQSRCGRRVTIGLCVLPAPGRSCEIADMDSGGIINE